MPRAEQFEKTLTLGLVETEIPVVRGHGGLGLG